MIGDFWFYCCSGVIGSQCYNALLSVIKNHCSHLLKQSIRDWLNTLLLHSQNVVQHRPCQTGKDSTQHLYHTGRYQHALSEHMTYCKLCVCVFVCVCSFVCVYIHEIKLLESIQNSSSLILFGRAV